MVWTRSSFCTCFIYHSGWTCPAINKGLRWAKLIWFCYTCEWFGCKILSALAGPGRFGVASFHYYLGLRMHNFTSQGRLISQEKRGLIFDSTSHCLLLSISRNSCDIDFISFTFICAKSLTRSIPISRTTKVTTLHYQFHHCFWISQGHRDCFSSSFRLVWTRLPKHVVGLLRASKATFTHPIYFFFFFFLLYFSFSSW